MESRTINSSSEERHILLTDSVIGFKYCDQKYFTYTNLWDNFLGGRDKIRVNHQYLPSEAGIKTTLKLNVQRPYSYVLQSRMSSQC